MSDQNEFDFGDRAQQEAGTGDPDGTAVEPVAEAETQNRAPGGNGALRHAEGPLQRLIDDNFLQYASYVIRDRAIPELEDGLKPVQRHSLYSLKENDDG